MSLPSTIGLPGQVLLSSGTIASTSPPAWGLPEINLSNNEDFQELMKRVAIIEQRLAIVVPNMDLQARFPALQEAYDNYKLIEKLVNDQSSLP